MSEERVVIELNAREQRLWDRVRGYIVSFEPGSGSGMRDVLLLLPDLTVLLFRLLRDSRVHQILEGTNEIMRVIVARHLLNTEEELR